MVGQAWRTRQAQLRKARRRARGNSAQGAVQNLGRGTYQAGTSIWHTCVDHGTSSRGLLQQVSLGGGEHGARDLSTGVGGVGPAR